ncbi:MAG TPA: DUF411 domain-containing protein [Vicinamibacterales bacterium]|nr:DUF411 domain-containing protein [Vicinamibacterales bacterium]
MHKPTLLALLVLALTAPAPAVAIQTPPADQVTVYRVKTCGCCGKWIDHLRAGGFTVEDRIVETRDDAPPRAKVPEDLRSCHTAQVGGYIVEGHIPAHVVKDLLRQRPDVLGIAVPGMPEGSPGMESPNPVAYEVIAFDAKGGRSVFAKIDPAKQ